MYAYFGGFTVFGGVLPLTGYVQLLGGGLGEAVVVRDIWDGGRECGDKGGLWASYVGLGLYCTYAVLFLGDVWNRGEKRSGKEE